MDAIEVKTDCAEVCGAYYPTDGSSDDDDACEPGDPFLELWPTVDDCVTVCSGIDRERLVFFNKCVEGADCNDPKHCTDLPSRIDRDCVDACVGLEALCGEKLHEDHTPLDEGCAVFCTVLLNNGSFETVDGSQTCLSSKDNCPFDKDSGDFGLGAEFMGCLVKPSETCEQMCQVLDQCGMLDGQGENLTKEVCPGACALTQAWVPSLAVTLNECLMTAQSCDIVPGCLEIFD